MLQDTVTFDAFVQRLKDQFNSDDDPTLDKEIVQFLRDNPNPIKSPFADKFTPEFFKVFTKAAASRLEKYDNSDARHILWAARCYCRAGQNQIAPGDDAKKMALAFLRSREALFEAQLGKRGTSKSDTIHHFHRSFWCYTHALRIASATAEPLSYLSAQYRFRGNVAQEISEIVDEPNWSWRAAEDAELSAGASRTMSNRAYQLATSSFRYYETSVKTPEARLALLNRSFDIGLEAIQHGIKQVNRNRWAHLCGNLGRVTAQLATFGKREHYQRLARQYLTLALTELEQNPHAQDARYAIKQALITLK